jgi:predicted ABC-type ATPase
VPEEIIRRRYNKGISNFFRLYKPLADTWSFYDNSVAGLPTLLASGGKEIKAFIENRLIWKYIQEEHNG